MAETLICSKNPLTGFEYDSSYGYFTGCMNPEFSLVPGKKYKVFWDDTENPYSVTAFDATIPGAGDFVAIGNGSALGYQGNNEPFAIAVNSEAVLFFAFEDSASSHIVQIFADTESGIILKDRDGNDVTYANENGEVPTIKLDTPDGGTQTYIKGETEEVTVTLDFSDGDMEVVPDVGKLFSKVLIQKPDKLIPENIAKNEDVAGIIGTLVGGGNVQYTYDSNGEIIAAKLVDFTTIPPCIFAQMDKLESVDLSESPGITTIGKKAFYYCTALKHVNIPDSVKIIDNNAFDGCSLLEGINIPDGVTRIGAGAFSSCKVAFGTSLVIPDSVKEISANAFASCYSLKSVTLPNGLTNIPNSLFQACNSLANVTIPDSVTNIGNSAFRYCTALKSITIPANVSKIEKYAFQGCTALTSATLKDTSGWYVSTNDNATSGTNIAVTNTSTAANYLVNTYATYIWYDKT